MASIREFNFVSGPQTPTLPTSPDPLVDDDLVTLRFGNATFAKNVNITGTTGAPSSIVAGTGIVSLSTDKDLVIFVEGSGGAVDITAVPQIEVGTSIGQRLTLIGTSDTNTLKLDNATGLFLTRSIILKKNFLLSFIWDGTVWNERFFTEDLLTLANITGTLAIASGGTGQTAAQAAFDALAPVTTEGDILVRGATTLNRLAIGADTEVLTVDTAVSGKLKYTAPSGGGISRASIDLFQFSSRTGIVTNFVTVVDNTAGGAMTLTSGGGDKITINTAGLYSIVFRASMGIGAGGFITKNSITITSTADDLGRLEIARASTVTSAAWVGFLAVNDVIRFLAELDGGASSTKWRATIIRIL